MKTHVIFAVLLTFLLSSPFVNGQSNAYQQELERQRREEQQREQERREQQERQAEQRREEQQREQQEREAEQRREEQQREQQERQAEQQRQQQREWQERQAEQQRAEQQREQQERQAEQQREQQRREWQERQAEQQRQQQREWQERQAEQQRQQQREWQERQAEQQRAEQQREQRERQAEQQREQQQKQWQERQSEQQRGRPKQQSQYPAPSSNSPTSANRSSQTSTTAPLGPTVFTPHTTKPAALNTSHPVIGEASPHVTKAPAETILPAPHANAPRTVPALSQASTPVSSTTVAVVAPPATALAAAQAQLQAAQAGCAQADAYQNYVSGLANTQNMTQQGISQMLQTIADNTSDPTTHDALTNSIGQPDPINDTLQEQLQNMARTNESNCQARLTTAQSALAAAQSQAAASQETSSAGSSDVQVADPFDPTRTLFNRQKATILLAGAQNALKSGDTARGDQLTHEAQQYQASSSHSVFPLKVSWGTAPLVKPMFVAFSFSTPALASDPDFGGDGAAGWALSSDEQTAIDQSGVHCAIKSQRPDWCGNGNGGNWEVCRADGKAKWVALATNNDGTFEDWSDGEVIAADTENAAEQGALASCGKQSCQLLWSQVVDCGNGTGGAANGGQNSVASSGPSVAPANGTPSQPATNVPAVTAPPKSNCPWKVCAGAAY